MSTDSNFDATDDQRGCLVHDGRVHGGEAEQLRSGIERILEDDNLTSGQVRRALQELIDSVNARDSLAYLERKSSDRSEVRDLVCHVARHAIHTIDNLTPEVVGTVVPFIADRVADAVARPELSADDKHLLRWCRGMASDIAHPSGAGLRALLTRLIGDAP